MKINQLFKDKVPEDLVQKVLSCFGLVSMRDPTAFSKEDMGRSDTVERLRKLIDELRLYYLPCKAKIYLHICSEECAITLLRQLLRLYDVSLESTQKYVNKKKTTLYHLKEHSVPSKNVKLTNELVHVVFE